MKKKLFALLCLALFLCMTLTSYVGYAETIYSPNNAMVYNYQPNPNVCDSIEKDGLLFLQLGKVDTVIGVIPDSSNSTSVTVKKNGRIVVVYFDTNDFTVDGVYQELSGITFVQYSKVFVSSDFFEKAFGFTCSKQGTTIYVKKMTMDVTVSYPNNQTSTGQIYTIQKDNTTYVQLGAICPIVGAASVDDGITNLNQKKVIVIYGQKKTTASYNSNSILLTSPEISPVTVTLSGNFQLAYIDGYQRLFAPIDLFSMAFGINFTVTPSSFTVTTNLTTRYYAYNVSGTVGDGVTDDGPAIQAALTQAMEHDGYSVLVFPPNKTFYLGNKPSSYPYFTIERYIEIIGEQQIIHDKKNFSIEGNGSTLKLNTKNSGFKLEYCTNAAIRGFKIDFEEVPYTQGKVVEINPNTMAFDVEIEEGFALPPDSSFVTAQGWVWEGGGGLHGLVFNDTTDGPNAVRQYSTNFYCSSIVKVQGSPRRYRFILSTTTPERAASSTLIYNSIKENEKVTYGLGHLNMTTSEYYAKFPEGNFETFDISRSINVTLEDNDIYGSLGMGVRIADNDGKVTLRRTNICINPNDKKRLLSTPSDGIHTKNNRVGITLDNCLIESTGDDSVNVSTMYYRKHEVVSNSVIKIKTVDLYYCVYTPKIGDTLMFLNLAANTLLGERTITDVSSVVDAGVTIWTVTLNSPLESNIITALETENQYYKTRILNKNQRAKGTVIAGCTFRPVFRNSIFGNFDGGNEGIYTIENIYCNKFEGQRGGVIGLNFCADADVSNGDPHVLPYSNNVRIIGNEFISHKSNAILQHGTAIKATDGQYLTRNINVSNNTCQTNYDYIMVFENMHNCSGSGNVLKTTVAQNKRIVMVNFSNTITYTLG